jgi:hypothetical protein
VIRSSESPFASAVLTNRLSTLSLSIPPVQAKTLVEPIRFRQQQLVDEIIPIVQNGARWISYQTYIGALGGVLASWTVYVPPFELVSASTAIGLGMLSITASIWSGQTRWHRVQKSFWRSWERSTDMLSSDIKVDPYMWRIADTIDCILIGY